MGNGQSAARALDACKQDIRYAFRTLRRDAGFTVFALLILGLGIGANTAVFSIAEALLFRPLPLGEPERLVWIANTGQGGGMSAVTSRASNLRDWRRLNKSFEELGGYFAFFDYGGYNLTGSGEPERLVGVGVTETFLPVLGIQPMIGRHFVEEECVWKGRRAVMLTYAFWQRRFGASPAIVGQSITLNDEPTAVVGVLPASFDFGSIFSPGSRIDILTPFPVTDETDRWGNTLAIVGRLKRGVTLADAQAELALMNEQLKQADPGRWGLGGHATPLQQKITGRFRTAIFVLIAAVAGVLLIACANLSNLLLARAASRRREMAIRSAIGATRLRLARQMLTEAVLLSAAGAALGVVVALVITKGVAATPALSIPMLHAVRIDASALWFAMTVALLTGVLFGIVPAFQVSGRDDHDALKDSTRGASEGARGKWIRSVLTISEIAVACVLVVGAGLLLRSFLLLLDVDLGFQADRAAAWRIETGQRLKTFPERLAYHQRLVREIERLPGVDSVGLTDTLPLSRNRTWSVRAKGVVYGRGQLPLAFPRMVDAGYLTTMKIPLVAGRHFTNHDTGDAQKVLIVNETMAKKMWPNGNVVGQFVLMNNSDWQVVGVVKNVRHGSLEQEGESEMYMPITQQPDWGSLDLVVRSRMTPASLAPEVRAALRRTDPALPVSDFQTLGELVQRAVSPRRFVLQVLGAFAVAALILASLGIYAVVSYSVGQRMQEFGIRMALGASGADVVRRVMMKTLALTATGIVIGLCGSLAVSKALSALLYGIESTDVVTFAAMATVLTGVALVAGYVPARRATRIDLASVLRGA